VITQYLQDWRSGNPEALSRLTALMYAQLRRVASGVLRGGGPQTLQPTVLVNELYLRLPELRDTDWESRAHFLNLAAAVMRRVVVDYCRAKRASKRGGGAVRVELTEASQQTPGLQIDVLLVHELLDRFEVDYPRQAKVVQLRFFGGLTETETAEVLRATAGDSSARTVARDWVFAKAWLQKEMLAAAEPE
jgi:RNA polymerase sigma factor (TIGR02999 family)